MRRDNLLAQLIYRSIWAIVGIIATILTITDRMVEIGGDGRPVALFFTAWSVWLSTLCAVLICGNTIYKYVKGERKGYNNFIPLLKFCSNIMIIATFVVSAFALKNEQIWTKDYWVLGSIFKHFLLPILTVLDYVFFDPKHRIRASYPLIGVLLPLVYWIVIIVRILIKRDGNSIPQIEWDNYYPYSFTNFDNGATLGGLCGLLAGICVGLILIGYIFWAADKISKNEEGKLEFKNYIDEDNTLDIIHLIKYQRK